MGSIYICPVCFSKYKEISALSQSGNSLICRRYHCFDCAKEGYYNFDNNSHNGGSGDTKEMCLCRREFLSGDYYLPFAAALSKEAYEFCKAEALPIVADAGCGEGYYLRVLRDYFAKNGKAVKAIGADLAKGAIKLAAKCEKSAQNPINFCVASIFDLPLDSNCADVLLSVFAPVGDREAHRVLKSRGCMIVAGAGQEHLYELKGAIYDTPYKNNHTAEQYEGFELCNTKEVKYTFEAQNAQLKNLFTMTPYFWKTSKQDAQKLDSIDRMEVTAHFFLDIYKKI